MSQLILSLAFNRKSFKLNLYSKIYFMGKIKILIGLVTFALILNSCTTDDYVPPRDDIYFPPVSGSTWKTKSMTELNWDTSKVDDLYSFLSSNKTRAFIVLEKGKIVTLSELCLIKFTN